jgi:hypothetical protein
VSIYVIYKVVIASIEQYINTIMATLLNNIDLSRLNVTALDNKKNRIEKIKIK